MHSVLVRFLGITGIVVGPHRDVTAIFAYGKSTFEVADLTEEQFDKLIKCRIGELVRINIDLSKLSIDDSKIR